MIPDTLYFGGIDRHRCIWSLAACPSIISAFLIRAHFLIVLTTTSRFFPYNSFRRYFGIQMT